MRKMGPMKSLLGMLPGIGQQLKDLDLDDSQLNRTEAIIQSMTYQERRKAELLNNSRRRRVARGSGTDTKDVSQLVKGFEMVSQMGKQLSSMSGLSRMKALTGMGGSNLGALGAGGMPRTKASTKAQPKQKFRKRKRKSR